MKDENGQMHLCAAPGCERPAEVALIINVPATGMPIPEHDPLQCALGVRFCRSCAVEEEAQDWVKPGSDLRAAIENVARRIDGVPPDFERAFITLVEFTDPAWLLLQQQHEQRKARAAAGMSDEEFNQLINGPLNHPMLPLKLSRLLLALRCVVVATGPEGAEALRRHCEERDPRLPEEKQ